MAKDMKEIYTCSEHTRSVVMLYDRWRVFGELAVLMEKAFGMEKDSFGTFDRTISRSDISLLKEQLEQLLKDKLQVFRPFEMPNTSVTLFGKEYRLDTRNEEHNAIRTLAMLLRMADTEIESEGTIWFYEHQPVSDNVNPYILSVVKAEQEGIEPGAAFEKLKERFEQFMHLPLEEFTGRIEVLKTHNFLIDKEGNRLYPSEKTLRIDSFR